MSRGVAIGVALALAISVVAAPVGPIDTGSRASAADCSWQRNSKRVVKRVKRHGKMRRLVRTKRWWTCEPLVAPPALAAPPASAIDPGPAPAPPPEPTPARLSVKATEFSYTLSRPSVIAGEAIVELNNQGEDPHNLNLQLEGHAGVPLEVSEAGPLEHRTARFTLVAGAYRLWCSLPEHEEKGMQATLLVTPD